MYVKDKDDYIAIIDYKLGNVKSVINAFEFLNKKIILTSDEEVILNASHVILPGVGAFSSAIEIIKKQKLDNVIKMVISNNIPMLGICLGMQMLYETSTESLDESKVFGLNVLKGEVVKFDERSYKERGIKVPAVGWQEVKRVNKDSQMLFNLENEFFYFVHSFYTKSEDARCGVSDYGTLFTSCIEKDNLFATQFHPEKSGNKGIELLKNFLSVKR